MKNLLKIGLIVFAAIWLLGKCSGCGDDYAYDSTSDYKSTQDADYSWLYGTWQLTIDGETHTICFLSSGICTEHFSSPYGSNNETSRYTIESNSIKVDCGDGYPSYIGIDGKRLKSNGRYYTKTN